MGRPRKLTPAVEKAPPRLAGSIDLLPEYHFSWDVFLEKLATLAHNFGYTKVETPMFEDASLFGFWAQNQDQLLTLNTTANRLVAVRPANIFSLARVYLEHHFAERERVSKWYYYSPVAWVAQNQIRQTHEYGLQIFGAIGSIADAQLINLLLKLFSEMGLANLSLAINNIGCIE